MIAAPISETHGRNLVYRTSLPVSALFTLGAGFSHNFPAFLVCRFFAGCFAAPVLAVGVGSSPDMFPQRFSTYSMASLLIWPFAGPSLG